MNSFLSEIKNSSSSSKTMSLVLINIFQIQLTISMLLGTSLNIFESLEFLYGQNRSDLQLASLAALVVHIGAVLVIMMQMIFLEKSFIKSSNITKLTVGFIHFYKNVAFIPVMYLVFKSLENSLEPSSIAMSTVNGLIGIGLLYIEEISCQTYRFRVKNYHQKLINTFSDTIMITFVIAINCLQSHKFGAILLIFKNVFRLTRLYVQYEEPVIQRTIIFGNFYQLLVSILVLVAEFMNFELKGNLPHFLCILVFGYLIISQVTYGLSLSIYRRMLAPQSESQNTIENAEEIITSQINKIRSLAMVLMEKEKYDMEQENEFDKWWQFYNREIIEHQIWCEDTKCSCKDKVVETEEIFLGEIIKRISQLSITFLKEAKLTIMYIYQYIQLSKKPLKAYYELTKLKLDAKKTVEFQVELKELTIESRECFDQLFLKHKVKNQKLQLAKVIEFEELLIQSQHQLKHIVSQTIRFYSLFNHNSVKLFKIKQESNHLSELKAKFESKLLLILNDYSSNNKLTVLIHFFYNYVEVYLNKESELKKITQSQLLKKRFLEKTQVNVFCPDYGTILIDLVEEKGKIKNLTKNMCAVFGYPKEDMTSMNINQFMPRLFGYHHAKFLNNFIQKGKIKLLTYSERDIFGKNKKKFIFPLKVSLKAEYLQDNFFGSSGLIKQVETFSEYILADRHGKIEEMTQSLYRKVFAVPFQQQPQKVNRLHINKVIPSFNLFFDEQKEKYDKIYEGIFLFCSDPAYLLQKFRYLKDGQNKYSKTVAGNNNKTGPSTYSIAVSNTISKSEATVSNTMRKDEQKAVMAEIMKHFISQIDMEIIEGYKIIYRVSQIVTAEFDADLIEIISLKSFGSQQMFCSTLIEEFQQIIELFEFNMAENSGVLGQINELKSQLKTKSPQNLHSKTFNSSNGSGNNLMAIDAPRPIKSQNSKNQKSLEEIKSVEFEEENKFVDENQHLLEKASTNRSSADNTETESKKQVLVNTFSKENLSMDSRYSIAASIAIGLLILLLVSLLVLTAVYLGLLASEWTSVNFIFQTKQLVEYRSSLEEIELFQQSMMKNSNNMSEEFSFVQKKSEELTESLKINLQAIYDSVVQEETFNKFYIKQFNLSSNTTNSLNREQNSKEKLSMIMLLKQLLWRFSYKSPRNTDHFRSSYEFYSMELRQLEYRIDEFLASEEDYFHVLIFIMNSVYLILMIFLGVGIIPVYIYFRNEEKALTELLEYISFSQLKKSMQKLNIILVQLAKIDAINNLNHLKNQFSSLVSGLVKDVAQPIKQHNNQHPQIVTEENNSGSLTGRIICVGILLVIFLNNLSIFMLTMVNEISAEFTATIRLHKASYELQNKPAYLLNTYLKNVNHFLNTTSEQQYSSEMFKKIERNYFATVSQISTPVATKSQIYYQLQRLLNQPLCTLVTCSSNDARNTTTLDYLVYQFRNKFEFLSKNSSLSLSNQLKVPSWVDQNHIPQLLNSIQTILFISQKINPSTYSSYHSYIKSLTQTILIVNIVFIIVNSILLMVVKNKTFGYFSSSIKETLLIFRHFDLETLSENTYLTSYFSNKLKEAK